MARPRAPSISAAPREGQLRKRFLPIVQRSTEKVGLVQQYDDYAEKVAALGLVKKEDANLEEYVTQKSLDGLFFMVAEEEKAIRKDPVAAGTAIIRKVFGALLSLRLRLVRLVPVVADADLDDQRHLELARRRLPSARARCALHGFELGLGHFEHQLVVHLHDQLRARARLVEPVLHRDHRELDEVGRGALHRRVDRRALGGLAARPARRS